ncbi:hypothetical protein ACKWTF_009142 [Chironomus riparius]
MDVNKIKLEITRFFKMSGFQMRTEVAMLLVDKIKEFSLEDRKKFLGTALSNIQNQNIENNSIEIDNVKSILRDSGNRENFNEESETIFSVINAFDVPSYEYIKESKKFIIKKNKRKLLAPPTSRSEYIRNRYNTILQRILRHDLFAPNHNENIRTSEVESKKFSLKYAENLLSASTINEVVMLGLLSKFKEGKFYLEDPTGAIPIDLNEAKFHSGLYTEGGFMLAEGSYNDGVLKVNGLGFPPLEPATSSRAYFGTQNYWGGPSPTLLKYSKRLLDYERLNFGASLIFLSDCWLDDSNVMDRLKKLFLGFDDSPPIAIILMGPFLKNKGSPALLRSKFAQLSDILDLTFTLKNETDIVLVPDIEDPTSANILPRPPLPQTIVQDMMKKHKRVILATNPCRLQYCTQEIVVCRLDLLRKLCRNTIKFPENGQLPDHFARTLMCQASLTPFIQLVMPTYWDFDSSLSLYPLPDLIVIGDNSTDFQRTHNDCTIVNTGSFPRSKYSFKLYTPSSKLIEDSQIPDDDNENES